MDRRILKTKRAIKEAYLKLLRQKGSYKDIVVKELVDLADVNRSTFYLHYYDSDQVFEELIDEMFEDVSSKIPENGFEIEKTDEIISQMNELIRDNEDYSLIVSRASDLPYFSSSLLKTMKNKIDLGSFRNPHLSKEEKEFLMEMIAYMTYSMTSYLIRNIDEKQIEDRFVLLRKYIYEPMIEKIIR